MGAPNAKITAGTSRDGGGDRTVVRNNRVPSEPLSLSSPFLPRPYFADEPRSEAEPYDEAECMCAPSLIASSDCLGRTITGRSNSVRDVRKTRTMKAIERLPEAQPSTEEENKERRKNRRSR